MKTILWLVVLWLAIFSSVCYGHDVIEVGRTLVSNPVTFDDTRVGGGWNLAFFSETIIDSFGIGSFMDVAYAPDRAYLGILTGPYYEFYISDKFSLPVSAGFLLSMPFVNFGFGGNITAQYELHPNFAIYGRIQCAYAYFIFPGVPGVESFILSPCIGLGLRF
jgi:hypothetical protein